MVQTTATLLILPLVAAEGAHLEAWEIGVVAFAFVGYILVIAAILEQWEERLHA